jgi:hypothetical protein
MTSSASHGPTVRARRFRPDLESLAERIVPATTITERNGVLTVFGNAADNVVIIRDNGGTGAGSIFVESDLNSYSSKGTVRSIRVFAGDGNDRVTYDLGDNLDAGVRRRLLFDLGAGLVDRARATITGNINRGALMSLTILGSAGSDRIQVNSIEDVDVNAAATLKMRVIGGQDQDRISTDFEGDVDGNFRSFVDGGESFDSLRQRLDLNASSTGTVRFTQLGGTESDALALFARTEPGITARMRLRINGGDGFDRGRHTFNVLSVGCEDDHAGK